MPGRLEQRIDDLYARPPAEFVERRNRLAASLREEGEHDAAAQVKALRKPTVAAWAVNQLARREKMRLRALLTAGERLRQAHGELLGGGGPEALEKAREGERKAIRELAGAAEALLDAAGHPASEATLDRVRDTLHAAAVDEEVGRRVREGRLEKEERAAGLGFGSLPAAPPKRPGRAKRDERKAKRAEAARERHRRAEERLEDARRAVREVEQDVAERARELERAERELRRRKAEAERAAQELERARAGLPGRPS